MSKEELQESLEALKAEIGKLQHGDAEVRSRVDDLLADVESQLEESEPKEASETISQRVSHFVEQMEIEHPITETLNRFLTALGEMGI